MKRVRLLAIAVGLAACASAQAETLPKQGRFNLHCSISMRTVSGPPIPSKIEPTYAVDLASKSWCSTDDRCHERYGLHWLNASTIEFVVSDTFANHEKFMVNLDNGKLVGSADDAPNGLINGFRTYLAEGTCVPLPYREDQGR